MKGIELSGGLSSRAILSRWRGSTAHRKLVEGVRAVLEKMGYCLKRAEQVHPVDLRGHNADPRLLGYYRGNRPILVDVPMERGIGLDICSLAEQGDHPFVSALQAAVTSPHPKEVLREVLSDYYRRVQPDSAAQWLGFDPGEIPALDAQPPWVGSFRGSRWTSTPVVGA